MKGELRLKVLEVIAEGVLDVADSFSAILGAGYGASTSKVDFEFRKIKRERVRGWAQRTPDRIVRQRFAQMMYFLKKDNLIEKNDRASGGLFRLTRKGLQQLRALKKRLQNQLPAKNYSATTAENFVIVAFDVPEKERRKRDWLREVLKNMELRQIQRSVWMGKKRIPRELLTDIERLKLAPHVEIFEIKKSGTLRHVV